MNNGKKTQQNQNKKQQNPQKTPKQTHSWDPSR